MPLSITTGVSNMKSRVGNCYQAVTYLVLLKGSLLNTSFLIHMKDKRGFSGFFFSQKGGARLDKKRSAFATVVLGAVDRNSDDISTKDSLIHACCYLLPSSRV